MFECISQTPNIERPKLVVGITVDQMRWDFLYRYYNRYTSGGFRRLVENGFSCENTLIPYTPTVTAAGHTCLFTGSVPAIHGIAGNNWYDIKNQRVVYCSEDSLAKPLGTKHESNGNMSPANLLTTTIGDELKLATNKQSKVIGVCIKDRGAIFPAGHMADAAFWYDASSGNWISSTYYFEELPTWIQKINENKLADKYYKKNWNTLYPIDTYTQSTSDEKIYEGKYKGNPSSSFPYRLDTLIGKNYSLINGTPYGNSMTLDIAKAAIENYQLGNSGNTDMLTLSFSSPDYVGHQFGPNSIEVEDTYLRLDVELNDFFNYLDEKIGKDQYLIFLSADHGVAHAPGFNKDNKLPGRNWSGTNSVVDINDLVKQKFGYEDMILSEQNYQLYLNENLLDKIENDQEIIDYILKYFNAADGIASAFEIKNMSNQPLPDFLLSRLRNGYHAKRGGHIQLILEPGWIDGWLTGSTHGQWYNYDSHIPLLWYGWNIKKGKTNKEYYMTDVAPTLAALLKIQMPNGCIGKVVEEVLR